MTSKLTPIRMAHVRTVDTRGIKRWTRTALGGDSGEGKGSGISWWAQSGGEFISLGHFRIGTTVTEMPYAIEVMEV